MKFVLFVICYLWSALLIAQENTFYINEFKNVLNEEEIELFKSEILFKFRMYYESVLNILDERISEDDRLTARFVLDNLFLSYNSSITDYFDNPLPETKLISDYTFYLFHVKNKTPLFLKEYKYTDSVYIYTYSTRGINDDKIRLVNKDDYSFTIYKGQFYFLERFINSKLVTKNEIDLLSGSDLKKIDFTITHDRNENYQLKIDRINFVDKRDKNVEYKKIKEKILNSEIPWSNVANEEFVKELEREARANGIYISIDTSGVAKNVVTSLRTEDLSIANIKDFDVQKLEIYDILIPGLGHQKYGPVKSRNFRSILYGGLFVTSGVLTIKYANISNRLFRSYEDTIDPVEKSEQYDTYKLNKTAKNIFLGATIASWSANIIHLLILHGKDKKYFDSKKSGFNNLDLRINPSMMSLTYNY